MRTIALMCLLAGCGAAAPRPDPVPTTTPNAAAPAPARFAGHGPIVLRSRTPETQPPFYAELAADGSVTGARCGATRFTDDGVLEREGVAVARITDALAIETAEGTATGWHIEGDALSGTPFSISAGVIVSSDEQAPAITLDPVTAPSALTLALFATLLVCDDVAP